MTHLQDLPGQQLLPGMNGSGVAGQNGPPPDASQPALTYALLRDFERQPGCDEYTADGSRIKLLCEYIWVRQLTPDLTFEDFLARYTPLADFNEENRKHPDDAVRHHCPRSKAQADKVGKAQWSAREAVDMLVLYVDVCRECDRTRQPGMSLDEFLGLMADGFKTGEIQPPDRPAGRAATKAAPRSAASRVGQPAPADPVTGLVDTNNPLMPSHAGQRVIYAMPTENSRQVKGVVQQIRTEGDRRYVDFMTDAGELIEAANINHFVVCNEEPPATQPCLESRKHWIPKSQLPGVNQALQLTSPMGNLALDDTIYQWVAQFDCGLLAEVTVLNGQQGPYVDAVLVDPNRTEEQGQIVSELPPRRSVLGTYTFDSPGGTLVLEVCTRK